MLIREYNADGGGGGGVMATMHMCARACVTLSHQSTDLHVVYFASRRRVVLVLDGVVRGAKEVCPQLLGAVLGWSGWRMGRT